MKLSVVLCTYNGEQFLSEQLASLAQQTRLPDELVVCDDGSRDSTCSILEAFAASSPFPVKLSCHATNRGVVSNFIQGIKLCSGDLIAFCDQDDVWRPDKIARACAALEGSFEPRLTLYCSRLEYVDEKLGRLGLSQIPKILGFNNAIVENIAVGCTVVVGSELCKLLLRGTDDDMLMHDWWAYLVASAFGHLVYDATPTLLYRQHSANVAGWERKPQKLWNRTKGLLRRLSNNNRGLDSLGQAERFVARYPELAEGKRQLVLDLVRLREATLRERFNYALHPPVARNDAIEQWGLRVMLLMGWN